MHITLEHIELAIGLLMYGVKVAIDHGFIKNQKVKDAYDEAVELGEAIKKAGVKAGAPLTAQEVEDAALAYLRDHLHVATPDPKRLAAAVWRVTEKSKLIPRKPKAPAG